MAYGQCGETEMWRKTRSVLFGAAAAGVMLATGVVAAQASTPTPWRVVYAPHFGGELDSVTAIKPNDAWAAGTFRHGGTPLNKPFVEHWGGGAWRIVTIPHSAGFSSNTVAASSSRNVWVFGSHGNPNFPTPAAFRWDGSHWHSVPVPETIALNNPVVLSATNVWTIDTTSCTATRSGLLACQTLLAHWNGQSWRTYPIGTDATGLAGTSAHDIWAAGINGTRQLNGNGTGELVSYHFNGTRWTKVKMPQPRISGEPLVAAASPTQVWLDAVPLRRNGSMLVMHWNGRRWQQLTSPRTTSGTDPTADGRGGLWLGPFTHWTGQKWITVPVPRLPDNTGLGPHDVARVPGTQSYWTAGLYLHGNDTSTPIMAVYGPLPR